jgi:hypothetical protein
VKPETCAHGVKEARCVVCALAELRRRLPEVTRAVAGAREVGPAAEFTSGGAPSWEPINLAAMSLLQDINADGGLDAVEAALNTVTDPERLRVLQRNVRIWRSRATLILGLALAPYPLRWDRRKTDGTVETVNVLCPVVDDQGDCGGILRVHRDNDPSSEHYGRAAVIICTHDDEHDWPMREGGWLRLGVLLGGVA